MSSTNDLRRCFILFASCLAVVTCAAFVIVFAFFNLIGSSDAPPGIPCTVSDEVFQGAEQRLVNYQRIVSEIDTESELLTIEQENSVYTNPLTATLDGEAVQSWGSPLSFEEIVARYSAVLVEELHWSHEGLDLSYIDWQKSIEPAHQYRPRRDMQESHGTPFQFNFYIDVYYRGTPPTDVLTPVYQTYYQIRYHSTQSPC